MDGLLWGGAGHSQCGNGLHGAFGGKHPARQYRYDERMFAEYSAGSVFYPALGAGYGGGRSRARHVPVQLCCMYVFFHTFIYKTKKHLCMHSSEDVPVKERNHCWRMRGGDSRRDPESAQCDRYDGAEQFYFLLRGGRGGGDGDRPENQYGSHECCFWLFTGHHAADQLQLCFRQSEENETGDYVCREIYSFRIGGDRPLLLSGGRILDSPVYKE